MIREILHFIISLPSLAVKFVEWVFNPKNGDEWVTPFTRRFLSTGASFVITVLYHVTAGLWTFITEYLFGAIAQVVHIVKDIVLDLWRANPSYSRWAARGVATAVVFIGSVAIVAATIAVKTSVAAVVAVLNALR